MKVSKKELRKIIREERSRMLRETVADMVDFEDAIQGASGSLTDIFIDKMFELTTQDDDTLVNLGIDEATWEDAVNEAAVELDSALGNAIAGVIEEMEQRLVSGDFAGASQRRTGAYG